MTMRACLERAARISWARNDSRCVAPELLSVGRDTLVLLPRTERRFRDARADRASGSCRTALSGIGFAWIRSLGGLYALSYHSQLLSRPEHLPALGAIARTIASDATIWVATAGDISRWWLARSQLQASAVLADGNRLEITVRNRGTNGVRGSVIRVFQPSELQAVRSSGQLLRSEPGVTRVLIPFIAARQTKVISVALGPTGVAAR